MDTLGELCVDVLNAYMLVEFQPSSAQPRKRKRMETNDGADFLPSQIERGQSMQEVEESPPEGGPEKRAKTSSRAERARGDRQDDDKEADKSEDLQWEQIWNKLTPTQKAIRFLFLNSHLKR